MVNRWSLYQALACRMWARSALYQSSGAYGFRDQLQDVLALLRRLAATPLVADAGSRTTSLKVFQTPHSPHWPCHLPNSAPHSLQT